MRREPSIKIGNEIIDPQLVYDAFQMKILFDVLVKALSKRPCTITMREDKDSQYIKIKRK